MSPPGYGGFRLASVSPALDAANVAGLVLDLMAADDVEKAAEPLARPRHVDMYVQEIEKILPGARTEEDQMHPLMQAEIARQLEDLEMLSGGWQEGEIMALVSPMRSNINIG
jgi:hypothetical protein